MLLIRLRHCPGVNSSGKSAKHAPRACSLKHQLLVPDAVSGSRVRDWDMRSNNSLACWSRSSAANVHQVMWNSERNHGYFVETFSSVSPDTLWLDYYEGIRATLLKHSAVRFVVQEHYGVNWSKNGEHDSQHVQHNTHFITPQKQVNVPQIIRESL